LDDVVGPTNWWDVYDPGEKSVVCHLTIRLPDGTALTKCDAGGFAGMSDAGDDEKSGFSDAFKRAAAKFGVGRYLYGDGVPNYVDELLGTTDAAWRQTSGASHPSHQESYRPEPSQPAPRQQSAHHGQQRSDDDNLPHTGRSLFAWCKKKEDGGEKNVVNYFQECAKRAGYPDRLVQLSENQVSELIRGYLGE
jgi:hypothetical protein